MPDDTKKPDASQEGTPSASDKAGTDQKDTPQKYVIDGKEVSIDEIKAGIEAKANEAKWRADLDKRGHELNETKRGLKDLEGQLTGKLTELQSELAKLKNPPVDLNSIEDPDERRKAEIKVLTTEIDGLKDTISSLQTEIKAKDEQSKRDKLAAYWQGIIDDTIDSVGRDLDDDDREDLIEKTEAKMGRVKPQEWTPDLWREKAKLSLEQIKRKNQKKIDNYGKKKGEKDKDINLDAGGTDVPKHERITHEDDQETRIKKMAQSEGINLRQ